MIAIIAEKPSVAREIAGIVGATGRYEGYLSGNNYQVTWAFGHLLQLAMPEEYGFSGYNRGNLPIIPQTFKILPRQIRDGKETKPDPGVLKQLNILKNVFSSCDKIIVATDAGREGELIFRLIYNYLGCKKPFERLWISSLTDKAIKEGLQNLKTGSDYENLYQSAKARSEADWLIGINASQALTIAAGSGNYSLGRVQTPTLAMICSRYLENKNFVSKDYFQLKLNTTKDGISFDALSTEKFETQESANDVLSFCREIGQPKVENVERKEVNQEPPLLYDLTTLQKDANTRFGFSADNTLTIAQGLYEKKLISYPRTGSRYLSADVMDEIPHLIDSLKSHPKLGNYATTLENVVLNIRSVDDKKVTDHHALIITDVSPVKLSEEESKIYDLIAGRMLEAFSKKCIKDVTTATLSFDKVLFQTKGTIIKQAGWRNVFNLEDDNEKEENIPLPELISGELQPLSELTVLQKQTKPKPLYTESSLLGAMENAGRELEGEEQREAIKDCGIGTPATRASIIETLLSRDYMVREKKSLIPTEKGLSVYEVVKDMRISDVEMTGNWESTLAKIEKGEVSASTFRQDIEAHTRQITEELLNAKITNTYSEKSAVLCPKCKSGSMLFYSKVVKCNNIECGLPVFKTVAGKSISDTQITDLLTKGKTALIKGFTSKAGRSFDAHLIFDDAYRVVFEFPEKKSGANKNRK